MKKLAFVFFAVITAIGCWGSTAAARMYFSGNLGVAIVDDADAFDGYDQAVISFDPGFTGTVAFGITSGYGLRSEFEIGYRSNEIEDITVRGYRSEPLNGDFSTTSMMGNILVDFMPGGPQNVFIGGGIGLANAEVDFGYYGTDDDTVLAYQLMAGVSLSTGYNMWMDIQYRYFATEDPEFGYIEAEYATHNAMIGLRMEF
jgi:opacity protein-like surface antigen